MRLPFRQPGSLSRRQIGENWNRLLACSLKNADAVKPAPQPKIAPGGQACLGGDGSCSRTRPRKACPPSCESWLPLPTSQSLTSTASGHPGRSSTSRSRSTIPEIRQGLACIAHKSLEICAPKAPAREVFRSSGLTAKFFCFAEEFRCFLQRSF